MTYPSDTTSIPTTAAEAADDFTEPTVPPEAAPLLAAAGVQALAVKLATRRNLGAVLAGFLTMVMVSFARRALAGRAGA